jgi:hypothetical protein
MVDGQLSLFDPDVLGVGDHLLPNVASGVSFTGSSPIKLIFVVQHY